MKGSKSFDRIFYLFYTDFYEFRRIQIKTQESLVDVNVREEIQIFQKLLKIHKIAIKA